MTNLIAQIKTFKQAAQTLQQKEKQELENLLNQLSKEQQEMQQTIEVLLHNYNLLERNYKILKEESSI